MTRRLRAPLLAAAVAVVAALLTVPAQAASPAPKTYVALGDSYAAGPLIPAQVQPWGCLKSDNNYPNLLARRLGLELRDASCSGATTNDMKSAQGVSPEPNPPQFDSLDTHVSLVTLQIGGNDIGFTSIAQSCIQAAFQQTSCKSQFKRTDGSDELQARIDATAPKIAAVIHGIHQRSPKARVLVLAYPGIFRIGAPGVPASCPAMGVGEGDAEYLRGVEEALDHMIATVAGQNHAKYVDVYAPSTGKTACDLPVLRWVEPLLPVNAAAPIHPNLNGMLGISDVVQKALTGTGGGDDIELPPGTPAPPPVASPSA